ncbi:hypothetical protein ACFU76_17870 [Streptomyces sp. NPDC057539]|uniref:hypothetical protein n=1 Tax=Streptomyces sp. NPDC057539 TaxID=3346159 RepID=UPI00369CD3D4
MSNRSVAAAGGGEETLRLRGDGERVRVETGPAPVTPNLFLIFDKEALYALATG